MQHEEFEKLLKQSECDYLDFKRELYKFSSQDKDVRAEFVKDVICMWNTPRQSDAYIIFGVEKHDDGSYDLCGISHFKDDAIFQDQLKGMLEPMPQIRYVPIHDYQGKNFGVLVVSINKELGVCYPQEKCKGMLPKKLYARLNSQNSEITDYKRIQWILNWFDGKNNIIFQDFYNDDFKLWDTFCDSMSNFSQDYYYILITFKFQSNLSYLSNLGYIDWLFVIDFDDNSEADGLLSECKEILENRKVIHLVTKGNALSDIPITHVNHGCYWYFANGLKNMQDTLVQDETHKSWNRMYQNDIEKKVDNLAKAISGSKPLKILVIIDKPNDVNITEKLRTIFQRIDSKFPDRFSSVIICPEENSTLENIVSQYEGNILNFSPIDQFLNGLQQFSSSDLNTGNDFVLPSRTGTPVTLPHKELLWLQEELEIVHLGAGKGENAKSTSSLDYLRGEEISWVNLRFSHDAKRSVTAKLQKKIREDLTKNRTVRVTFYHAPGAGGTTVAKRILWDFHEEYPCLVLRSSKSAKETSDRISSITKLCDKPLLLLIDSGLISNRESDALFNELAASHLSIVLLNVLRTFDINDNKRDFFLEDKLVDGEPDHFFHVLSQVKPDKKNQIDKEIKKKDVSPFSLGFLTFENDFLGIDNFVISRLSTLKTENQRKMVIFLAIAYFYGQEKIPSQWFNQFLDVPASKVVNLDKLNEMPVFQHLIIQDHGEWRIAHQIFAHKCLKILLPNTVENIQDFQKSLNSEEWKHYLSEYAKEFSKFCFDEVPVFCDVSKSLIYKIFYNRENSEILGTESASNAKFAKFIEDIPTDEGQLAVLRYLADLYSEEAHIWAHLGRFYSVKVKNFDKAIESIDKALQLNDGDFLIHHMKGMTIRAKAYEAIQSRKDLEEVVTLAEQASSCFEITRSLSYENEHSYISEVQMIIRVLDYAGKQRNVDPVTVITQNNSPTWLRESLERAFDLLAQVRQNKRGGRSSHYEEKCQAELDIICNRSNEAIQRWNSLLSRRDLGNCELASVRRSLVWSYLHTVKREWDKLEPKNLQRIEELLGENLKSDRSNDKNLKLWLQVIRYLNIPPDIEVVIERVSYWRQQNNSIEALYYLYVLYCLQAFEGSVIATDHAQNLIKECQERSRFQRKNEFSSEWMGNGKGIKQLLHESKLGEWNYENRIWEDTSKLLKVEGKIYSIDSPTSGSIEIKNGLKAFFVPAQSDHKKGRDEYKSIECFIGFSYSGLRAWKVKNKT